MDPNPDPRVRGINPRILIQILAKISWIRNTGYSRFVADEQTLFR
jgi:hypothetical protein